jgi:hypothetical protein
MKRFFFLPLLVLLLIATVGCSCEANGSVTMPTEAPTAVPTSQASPVATIGPTATAPAETTAPVMPTAPIASPSATPGS